MTDKEKLDKLVSEIERLYHQSLVDENRQAEWGLSSAACTSYGKSKVCKELLSFTDSMQKETKDCMYSKDNYTYEDRKVLCEGCEEVCEFNKKEEPVSEDMEKAAKVYEQTRNDLDVVSDNQMVERAFQAGAKWQRQQMMKKAIEGIVTTNIDGWINVMTGFIRPEEAGANFGNKVKLIIIKEDGR